MTEERCERSDLLVSQCGHCKGLDKVESFEYVVVLKTLAKYPGQCNACGGEIVKDETMIGLADEDGVGWVCESCFK